jgi:hypothetical protein
VRACVDELRCYAHTAHALAHAALELVAGRKVARDVAWFGVFAFVRKHGVPGHHGEFGKAAEGRDDVLRQTIGEILTALVITLILERQNGDRGLRTDRGCCRQRGFGDEKSEAAAAGPERCNNQDRRQAEEHGTQGREPVWDAELRVGGAAIHIWGRGTGQQRVRLRADGWISLDLTIETVSATRHRLDEVRVVLAECAA